ncbi:glycosyltransferase [Marinifilum sp. JC120]|nr:glycosyltransferase [Marinifilum sp. JC120]
MDIDKKPTISVLMPVFNNQDSLRESFIQVYDEYRNNFPHYVLEVLYINDGSRDNSWDILQELQLEYPEYISTVNLTRNFGQLGALLAGFKLAAGDSIVIMSADLQDSATTITEMVQLREKGNEVVIAYRQDRQDGVVASVFSKVAYGMARKANPQIPKGGFDYYLLSRKAADIICSFQGQHRFLQGDILWLGLPTAFIPCTRRKRKHGKSGWTFSKKLKAFIDLALDSSSFPLRMMSSFGAIASLGGVFYAVLIFLQWLLGSTPYYGWSPIMITILIIGGALMMMLGVIGEYIWRIYDILQQRPPFIIESINESSASSKDAEI